MRDNDQPDGDLHTTEPSTLEGVTQVDTDKQEPSQQGTDQNVSDLAEEIPVEKPTGNWYSKNGPATPGHSLPLLSDVVGIDDIAASQIPSHESADITEDENSFDPATHATDQWGQPILNKDGTYRRKRGRKKGSRNSATDSPAQETSSIPLISTDEAAKQSANLFINTGVLVFGDEWAPESKEEAGALKNAFKNYYDAKGVPNIPPEYGLAFALGAYSLNRLTKDNTRTKLQRAGLFLKEKFGRFFRRNKTGT